MGAPTSAARDATGLGVELAQLGEGDLEPGREALGVLGELGAEGVHRDPAPALGLFGVRSGLAREAPDESVVELVLGEARGLVVGSVDERASVFERHVEAHFFLQAALRGVEGALVRAWVAAAGVGPEPAEVVLGAGAFLEEEPARVVQDEDGEGAVERAAVLVGGLLFHRAEGVVGLVDEDDEFLRHSCDGGHGASLPVSALAAVEDVRVPLDAGEERDRDGMEKWENQ